MDENLLRHIEYMAVHGMRDDAMFWLDVYACKCLVVLRKEEDWLARAPNAEAPTPRLSELLRPGSDNAYGFRHRMSSLARRLELNQTEKGHAFLATMDDMEAFFEELKRVFSWRKIAEARTLFQEFIDYATTAKLRNHTRERFEKTVQEMLESFLGVWNELYELCVAEEGVRLSVPVDNAYLREAQEAVAEIGEAVKGKKKKGRPPTVAAPTKRWLVKRWFYLVDHPDCCSGNVKGKRVLHLDFWATYEKELKSQGLETYEDADRALRTALANARSGLLGEECRQLILNHSVRG